MSPHAVVQTSTSHQPSRISSPSSHASPPAAPSTPDSTDPRPVEQMVYAISPHTLRHTDCHCDKPRRKLSTAPEYIQYMLSRLRKVIGRLTGEDRVPADVIDAALRIMHELRNRGYELFHLVGWSGEILHHSNGRIRREFNVAFLVPYPPTISGHMVVGQITIHDAGPRRDGGNGLGRLDNVGARTVSDWEDWTVVQVHDYVREESMSPPGRRPVKDGRMLKKAVWSEVVGLESGCSYSERDFCSRLEKMMTRLGEDCQRVVAYEVGMFFRRSKDTRKTMPVVRITLHARDRREDRRDEETMDKGVKALQLEQETGRESRESRDQQTNDHIAAVFLVDLGPSPSGQKVKHMAVVYQGEWPVAHHYRRNTPKPTLDGLEDLVVD